MTGRISLSDIARLLEAELVGDADKIITGINNLQDADDAEITFLASKSYEKFLSSCGAGAILLKPEAADQFQGNKLLCPDPYLAYARLSALFTPRQRVPEGIHPSAVVHASAQVDPTACIGPQCVIEAGAIIGARTELTAGVYIGANSQVGDDGLIHANVSIYHNVCIGKQVIIHSGVVIGSDGFGFAPSSDGWVKIHQLGRVVIGDVVEIGASTAIDRGAVGDTVLEDGVIIDNQVHIAHNVRIGERTAIAGCVGIAGSTVIGKECMMGGAVKINGHLNIADRVHFQGGSTVTKSITEAGVYCSGSSVQKVNEWRRNTVRYLQLDRWVEEIKKLQKRLDAIDNTEKDKSL